MYEEIENRFNRNLSRVRNLADVYETIKGPGQGRRSVETTDVLRAAIVLLHASLEDFLRGLIRERLPAANVDVLNEIPLAGSQRGGRAEKFLLGALAQHRTKKVETLIQESIDEYYGVISFNDPGEIVARLHKVSIDYIDDGNDLLAPIGEMISRRHAIVHEADRNPNRGQGEYHAQGINPGTLGSWIENVEKFVTKILGIART